MMSESSTAQALPPPCSLLLFELELLLLVAKDLHRSNPEGIIATAGRECNMKCSATITQFVSVMTISCGFVFDLDTT